ncbi:2-amino-3,7-dideoxy-D-threo-hept-6-ulosonate synthase [Streptomyces rubradiris]|uniref:Fructose-bisphosphate aldolase n=1 Tax=Streptomyces rubradiris TaxID=285531 RepID=A0ABQ3RF41_STRRR|nr:fructose-bisphosphate aldolase [Streptomyces rubradiris]GHI54422.1 fructose-bisphosphate aldolase [Streptomyces rubradiris]
MPLHTAFARSVRLQRLHRHHAGRLFIVPLDHSVTDGPLVAPAGLDRLVGELADNHVDAVVLHKGGLRQVDPARFNRTSLIVHLSASTVHAPDPHAKYLVADVEESLRMGADAVSVHVNLGSLEEKQQIADMARVADACDRWNVPLMAMMYPRGPQITEPRDPALVAHAAGLAADLGADIVKTLAVEDPGAMADITRSCPIPIVVVGGPRQSDPDALDAYVGRALAAGAAGVAMGRNVFQAPAPGATARRLARIIHEEPARVPGPRHELTGVR